MQAIAAKSALHHWPSRAPDAIDRALGGRPARAGLRRGPVGIPPLPTLFLIATGHGHCSGTITLAAALITGGTVLGSRR
jgi:hypothetical protein